MVSVTNRLIENIHSRVQISDKLSHGRVRSVSASVRDLTPIRVCEATKAAK